MSKKKIVIWTLVVLLGLFVVANVYGYFNPIIITGVNAEITTNTASAQTHKEIVGSGEDGISSDTQIFVKNSEDMSDNDVDYLGVNIDFNAINMSFGDVENLGFYVENGEYPFLYQYGEFEILTLEKYSTKKIALMYLFLDNSKKYSDEEILEMVGKLEVTIYYKNIFGKQCNKTITLGDYM